MKFLILSLLLVCQFAKAEPISPTEISQQVLNYNRYESDDLAYYRYSVKKEWGKGIRVNIAPGGNFEVAPKRFALFENRYFYLNSDRSSLAALLDLKKIFSSKKGVTFSRYETYGTKSSFEMTIDKSNWLAKVVIFCAGESDSSFDNRANNSNYMRYQLSLKKCVINGRVPLLENSWITLDAFEFENVADKSALVLKAVHFNQARQIEGKSFSAREVSEMILGVEDELLTSLFSKLGYRIPRSNFLWTHQP